MAIFPNLSIESTLQVDDKTRIDATKSYVSKDEADITLVEIDPGDGTFRDVTGNSSKDWYLDWEYSTDGGSPYSVQVRITTDGLPVTKTETITVLTAADDHLFSNDNDLIGLESDILRYLPKGKNSFLFVHRKAQSIILSELDERGTTNYDGSRITKDQITEVDDFNKWSSYMAMWLIMQDLSNSVDDKFDQKSKFYKQRMDFHRERSFLRIDFNSDGTTTLGEFEGVRTVRMNRS